MKPNADSLPICASRAPMLALLVLTGVSVCAAADDRCGEFKWNVTHERALFATTPQAVTTAPDSNLPPLLSLERFYDLSLSPQDQVHFAQTPGKKATAHGADAADGVYAGIARVHIADAGIYRVALDLPFWVDLVDNGQLVASNDHAGQQGCNAPHKIVQYELHSGDLLLQLSGGTSPHLHLTITRAAADAATR